MSLDAGSGPLYCGRLSSILVSQELKLMWVIEGDLTAIAVQGAALGTVAGKPSVLLNMGLLHAVTASFISPCNLLGHTLLKPATQLYFFMLLLLQFFFFPLRNYLNRWLSLILIHLFQHLHRASVRKKKKSFAGLKK